MSCRRRRGRGSKAFWPASTKRSADSSWTSSQHSLLRMTIIMNKRYLETLRVPHSALRRARHPDLKRFLADKGVRLPEASVAADRHHLHWYDLLEGRQWLHGVFLPFSGRPVPQRRNSRPAWPWLSRVSTSPLTDAFVRTEALPFPFQAEQADQPARTVHYSQPATPAAQHRLRHGGEGPPRRHRATDERAELRGAPEARCGSGKIRPLYGRDEPPVS